jgi:hypothetical protein
MREALPDDDAAPGCGLMGIEEEIESIREGIVAGRFTNEASVSQGIVLRLLHALSWPTYDTQVVWPEYSLSGKRVDFALCHPPGKPIALIEVKQIGQSDGAERQLFEYAFHHGAPMVILTDGREWNFFLPGEQGDYGERRVYKLDIVERDVTESASRLRRYLQHDDVATGQAIQSARDDYRNVSRERQMRSALPLAWGRLIEDEDEMLLEILADGVESICGFRPDPDMVATFLKGDVARGPLKTAPPRSVRPTLPKNPTLDVSAPVARLPVPATTTMSHPSAPISVPGGIGFMVDGRFHPSKTAIGVLRQIFDLFDKRDQSFSDRFMSIKHGRSRRYLARERAELYPGRPDFCQEYAIELQSGLWMGTNYSRHSISGIVELACGVAGMKFGEDLIVNLGK